MTKESITNKHFYIKKILRVIKSQNPNHHKVLTVKERHSDAFVFILCGSCTYTVDSKEMIARAGDILYLAHNADYQMYIHGEDYKFIFCDFEFDTDSPRECAVFSPENTSYVKNLFDRLLHAYRSEEFASFAEVLSCLYSIYAILFRCSSSNTTAENVKTKIVAAKRYIDLRYMDLNMSVSALAKEAAMSEVYFRKLFKEEFGQSPSQYIISLRLYKARELMRYPFLSLSECALQSGFSSQQYFSKVFKEHIGVTPAKYREEK